jgi:2-oxoglutarate ferredoxin oxidoreductase subunit beta
MLARLHYPEFPEPMGVLYREDKPTYEAMVTDQVDQAIAKRGLGDLDKLFNAGDTYVLDGPESEHGLHD